MNDDADTIYRPGEEAAAPEPRSPARCCCLLLVLCALVCCVLPVGWANWQARYVRTYEALGPVHVLAGPEEAWVFVQVNRYGHHRDPLASGGAWQVAHRQAVVVLPAAGAPRVIQVGPEGVGFGRYGGRVFRHEGAIHALERVPDRECALLRWTGAGFEHLPAREALPFLREHVVGSPTWDAQREVLDGLTVAAGWEALTAELGRFTWRGGTYRVTYQRRAERMEVNLRSPDHPGLDPPLPLLTYDDASRVVTRAELEARYPRRR